MLRFPQSLWSTFVRLSSRSATLVAPFLFASSLAVAQSVPGLQSPEKPKVKTETPILVRAALGQAPLRKLYEHLILEPADVQRLRQPSAAELLDNPSEKVVRLGIVRPLNAPLNPRFAGRSYRIAEGEVRVAGVESEGALYTRVQFQRMSLPAGARVFVYSAKNPDEFYGPYERSGPSEDGTFWTPPLDGDTVVIEYFTPHGTPEIGATPFVVSQVSHIYRHPFKHNEDEAAGSCNLEVPQQWLQVAKSVGYLEFVSGGDELACTGTLLNNQSNDQTPFLLTANHCFSTQSSAQSLRVYWNYNTGDVPPAGTPFTDGANLLATNTSSDFTFVRLTGSLPGGLHFSGWDASPTAVSTNVTGLHHPETSHKRYSAGHTTSSSCPGGLPGPCSNFTHVRWDTGTTEPGSSGSGIWTGTSNDARLVGTLTGGAASCSNLSGIDHYGSFSVTYPQISSFLAGSGTDLGIRKTVASDQVSPGSQIVFLLTAINGAGSTANAVNISDNLPSQVTFVSCSSAEGTCGGSGNNRTVSFSSIAAGASATAVIVATVNSTTPAETIITNTATISASTADPNPNNNSSTAQAIVKTSPFVVKSNGKIAYFSDRAGSFSSLPTGIYGINANGSSDTLLKSGEFFGTAPAWSPDGTRIVYGRKGFDTFAAEIFVMNADGSGAVKIAGNVYQQNTRAAWSPNGTRLAYIGTNNAIFVVNADGTGLSRLPVSPASVNDLAWSPDGSKFAYSNGKDIFVMGIDGSGQTNLTQDRPRVEGEPVASVLPKWSPDGARILFGARSSNNNQIYVMNVDGSGLAPLITQHQSQQPAWSPDGAKITFVSLNMLHVANSNGTGITNIAGGGLYNITPDWQPLAAAAATIQLSANNYNISEAGGRLPITVTRSSSIGNATVNYATSDNAGLTPCNTVTTFASSRCDYATTVGTLRFSPGETSKTIHIPIVDDAYADGLETFTLTLSSPTGADLGTSVGTITIQDDSQPTANPMNTNAFFVRQHYIDFLGREPEPQGLQDWQNILANCGTTVPTPCDQIEVSSAFFRSPEFQSRGYFIYRFYSSVGKIPLYHEFMPDLAKVSGFLNDNELEANKVAFVLEFMSRPEFVNRYSVINTDAAGFVDAVLQTMGLPNHPSRQSYINLLNSHGNSQQGRALVLRAIVESVEAYNKYYNEAFVIMQYFGYLRRTADASYLDWIKTMNENGGDYRTMINGFLNSSEYRLRFGP